MPEPTTATTPTVEHDPGDATTVAVSVAASAPPVQVWDVLVSQTAAWWGEPYLGPGGGAMHLEPVLGGRVFNGSDPERAPLHGTIRGFEPPGRLEIGGVLVPGAYAGAITFEIRKTNFGSEIFVEHTALGRIEADVEERISHGWTQMLSALADIAER